jgi:hypothetical protein
MKKRLWECPLCFVSVLIVMVESVCCHTKGSKNKDSFHGNEPGVVGIETKFIVSSPFSVSSFETEDDEEEGNWGRSINCKPGSTVTAYKFGFVPLPTTTTTTRDETTQTAEGITAIALKCSKLASQNGLGLFNFGYFSPDTTIFLWRTAESTKSLDVCDKLLASGRV